MIQSPGNQPNDVIDLLFESVQKPVVREDAQGNLVVKLEADNKSLLYRTMLIPNPNFGGCILEVEKWIAIINDAKNNMCSEMSDIIYEQGMAIVDAYMYAFASKSSERVRDKDNVISSLTDLLQRNHVEKTVRVEDNKAGNFAKAVGLNDRDDQPRY